MQGTFEKKLTKNIMIFNVQNIDYLLLLCLLLLGILSMFTMYSTDGGKILYHTKSHSVRFLIFFPMMIILSFINIKFWHSTGYLFYIIVYI